jgi:hypothetical protein
MKNIILRAVMLVAGIGLFAQDIEKTMPVLPDSSNQSVLLRYKYTTGKKNNQHTTVVMLIELDMDGQNEPMNIDMKMDITGSYTVEKIFSDGGMEVHFVFTRLVVSTSSLVGWKFDSDEKEDPKPEFSKLRRFLNVPVIMKIDARGKTLSVDTSLIEAAMAEAGDEATPEEIKAQVDNFTKSTFIMLPEKAVKTGDIFDAGALDQDIPGLGTLTTQSRYRVAALSRDRKKMILEPVITVAMEGTDMSHSSIKGWMLFDTEKSVVEKSYLVTHLDFSFSQGGEEARIVTDTEIFLVAE